MALSRDWPAGAPAPAAPSGRSGRAAAPGRELDLVGFELSLATAPLDALDAALGELTDQRLGGWFDASELVAEAALLTTCQRIELLLAVRNGTEPSAWSDRLPGGPPAWRYREGRALVRHLFEVASGRCSIALGEGEIRGQVRAAGRSVRSRHPRPLLRTLLTAAADAAAELAPSVPPERSVAGLAAARTEAWMAGRRGTVVVLGTGATGRRLAELLGGRQELVLVYRHRPPPASLLERTGARTASIEELERALAGADALVTAARSDGPCLDARALPRDRPFLLIDLGVPRNVAPDPLPAGALVRLDLEQLRPVDASSREDPPEDRRLIERADRAWDGFAADALEEWIAGFRRSVEAARRAELAVARPHLGELDEGQRIAIERLTRRLVERLVGPATERLRELPPDAEGEELRRLALGLLRPFDRDP